jgi:putative hemolysin
MEECKMNDISDKVWKIVCGSLVGLALMVGLMGCNPKPGNSFVKDGVTYSMSQEEALSIARQSEYAGQGKISEDASGYVFNAETGTYWIGLEMDKPGCSPAIVVHLDTRQPELNYRCTGLVEPGKDACNIEASGTDAYMPNPAAVYCKNLGGTEITKTASDGSQSGFCQVDGTEVDEWELYRRDCLKEEPQH